MSARIQSMSMWYTVELNSFEEESWYRYLGFKLTLFLFLWFFSSSFSTSGNQHTHTRTYEMPEYARMLSSAMISHGFSIRIPMDLPVHRRVIDLTNAPMLWTSTTGSPWISTKQVLNQHNMWGPNRRAKTFGIGSATSKESHSHRKFESFTQYWRILSTYYLPYPYLTLSHLSIFPPLLPGSTFSRRAPPLATPLMARGAEGWHSRPRLAGCRTDAHQLPGKKRVGHAVEWNKTHRNI